MSAVDTIRNAVYGNPPTPDFKPDRDGVVEAFQELYDQVSAMTLGIQSIDTVADLPTDSTTDPIGSQARVFSDPTTTNNTWWIRKALTGTNNGWAIDADLIASIATVVQPLVDQAADYAAQAVATMAGIDAIAVSSAVYRRQLFDLSTLTDNVFISTNGLTQSNAAYFASDFIKWPPNITQVTLSRGNFIAQYNGTTFVAGTSVNPATNSYILTKAVGATHFRCSSQKTNVSAAAFMAVPGAVLPSNYIPFSQVLDGTKAMPGTFGTLAIADGAIIPAKVNFLLPSKNLFDKSSVNVGYMANNGGVVVDAGYYYSDYFPIVPGETYHSSSGEAEQNIRMWCFFANNSGTVLAGGSNTPSNGFVAPAGAFYCRASCYAIQINSFQIEHGSTATGFVPFGFKLKPDGYGSSSSTTGWAGKKWGALGDSITANGGWTGTVSSKLGLVSLNYGVSGTQIGGASNSTVAMFSDTRVNAMDAGLDLATLMGGTNDWYNSRVMGAITSVDSNEFNGALNLLIPKLIARYLSGKIVLYSPTYTERLTYAAAGWANARTNLVGLTPRDYADAVLAAAHRYNLPSVDTQQLCGWNSLNITTYVANDGELLHPNTAVGRPRVADIYVGSLNALTPTS